MKNTLLVLLLITVSLSAYAFFGVEGRVQAVVQNFDGTKVTVQTIDGKEHIVPRALIEKTAEVREGKMVWIDARIDEIVLRKPASK